MEEKKLTLAELTSNYRGEIRIYDFAEGKYVCTCEGGSLLLKYIGELVVDSWEACKHGNTPYISATVIFPDDEEGGSADSDDVPDNEDTTEDNEEGE